MCLNRAAYCVRWWNPLEPTETMEFFNNGVKAFEVQYFDGTNWLPLPNGTISGNTKVWRKITFPAVTAEKIRVQINAAKAPNSILLEVEAYGVPAIPPPAEIPNPTPLPFLDDLGAALAQHDIFIDGNNHIGFGTQQPIFNDDGTTDGELVIQQMPSCPDHELKPRGFGAEGEE